MKKLAFFFVILTGLVVIAGCNNRKTITRFSDEATAESEKVTESVPMEMTVTKLEAAPEEVKEPIELEAREEVKKEAVETKEEVKFKVVSMENNILKSDKAYHLIQGTTPERTQKIFVNNYPLSKYRSGDTKWSYIVAAALGNLKQGENVYTVKAVDKKGNIIAAETFTIVYNGQSNGRLASTGAGMDLGIAISLALSAGWMVSRKKKTA
jgi:hypothetical protein